MTEYIDVSAALIRRGNTIMVAQRPEGGAFAGRWEFPGGKFEPSEDAQTCLRREIQEELGIQLSRVSPFKIWEYDFARPDGKLFRLHSFWCEADTEPQLLHHQEIRWVTSDELEYIDLLDSNRDLIGDIKKCLS